MLSKFRYFYDYPNTTNARYTDTRKPGSARNVNVAANLSRTAEQTAAVVSIRQPAGTLPRKHETPRTSIVITGLVTAGTCRGAGVLLYHIILAVSQHKTCSTKHKPTRVREVVVNRPTALSQWDRYGRLDNITPSANGLYNFSSRLESSHLILESDSNNRAQPCRAQQPQSLKSQTSIPHNRRQRASAKHRKAALQIGRAHV